MALNLAATTTNHPLIVYNRTTSKATALAEEAQGRAVVAESLADLVEKSDVIFTNLANDEVVKSIYEEILTILQVRNNVRYRLHGIIDAPHFQDAPPLRNKIFVETSTVCVPSLSQWRILRLVDTDRDFWTVVPVHDG